MGGLYCIQKDDIITPKQCGSGFVEVRNPHTGKLLFKYDPQRELIEIQERGAVTLIDLNKYRAPAA